MTDRELLAALVDALRPLMDPEVCSPFITAWELDGHRSDIDGEEIHARIMALVQQFDGEAQVSDSRTGSTALDIDGDGSLK